MEKCARCVSAWASGRCLRNQYLGGGADLGAKHEYHRALRLVDGVARRGDLASVDPHLLCGQFIIAGAKGQYGGIFSPRPYVNELRSLFAQTNGPAVDND